MKPHIQTPFSPTIVGLGEALFDCFDRHRKLGGAPINFAIHAQQLLDCVGGNACVVSRVGADDLGDEIIQELNSREVDTANLQRDPAHPTGVVQVTLCEKRQPTYEITEGVAWDYIEQTPESAELAGRCHAVCFGTLAQRSPASRQSIRGFVSKAPQAVRYLDVNLRQSYYDAEIIESSLKIASVAKFNEEELRESAKLLGLLNGRPAETDELAQTLCRVFELDGLAVTRGDKGTLLFTSTERFEGTPGECKPEPQADSVGAGDSCNAGLLFGWLMDWPKQEVVQLANEIGAFVASRSGATPVIPDEMLRSFRLERHLASGASGAPALEI